MIHRFRPWWNRGKKKVDIWLHILAPAQFLGLQGVKWQTTTKRPLIKLAAKEDPIQHSTAQHSKAKHKYPMMGNENELKKEGFSASNTSIPSTKNPADWVTWTLMKPGMTRERFNTILSQIVIEPGHRVQPVLEPRDLSCRRTYGVEIYARRIKRPLCE
jgi:hypothetical protein